MVSTPGSDPGAGEDSPSSSINETFPNKRGTAAPEKSHNDTAQSIPGSDARSSSPDTDELATEKLHNFLEKMIDGNPDELKELPTLLRQNLINSHSKDYKSETALHIAARRGLIGATEALLKAHASVQEDDSNGSQPLHTACKEGKDKIVDLLLNHGVDVNARDHDNTTPLQYAVVSENLPIINRLVKVSGLGIDISGGLYGMTALNRAAWYGNVNIARALLNAGARVNVQDNDGWTPLWCAINEQDAAMVNLLLEHEDRSQLEIPDNYGVTPLLLAIKDKFAGGVTALLQKEANYNASADHKSCLHWAVLNFSHEVFSELMKQAKIRIDDRDGDGITALHYACGARDKDGTRLELGNGEDNPNANARYEDACLEIFERLCDKGADLRVMTSKDETALHFAARYRGIRLIRSLLKQMPSDILITEDASGRIPLDALLERDKEDTEVEAIMEAFIKACQDPEIFSRALLWAATNSERHKTATLLLSKNQDNNEAKLSDGNSAIEWATYREMPEALWWLIATSPPGSETTERITSAKKLLKPKESRNPRNLGPFSKDEDQDNKKFSPIIQKQKKTKERLRILDNQELPKDRVNSWAAIGDILDDPPIAQIYNENRTPEPPILQSQHSAILEKYKALIAEFYRRNTVSRTIWRKREVGDIIYKQGPIAIMEEAAEKLNKILDHGVKHNKQSYGIENVLKTDNRRFAWVHLPATNIEWMKDLLTQIMINEKYSSDEFHKIDSFLRDTWFETPDRESSSRIMRPQFVKRKSNTSTTKKHGRIKQGNQQVEDQVSQPSEEKRDDEQGVDGNEDKNPDACEHISEEKKPKGEKTDKKENEDSIAISAVYMPFVSFSTHSRMIDSEKTTRDLQNNQEALRQNSEAWKRHQDLMDAYKNSVIHKSSTLDESYYHFSNDVGSQKDRRDRNQRQVVAKLEDNGKKESESNKEKSWPVVRVNQLWVWTIANKWIISATSHPVDDVEQKWVEGFREHLKKRVEARGARSQPDSTDEMTKLLVDYCIGSYERRRTYAPQDNGNWKSGLSIRQSFSDYLNLIGRHETELFRDFRSEIKQQKGSASHNNESKATTSRAEFLFAEVKDIRDELNILKSIATSQSIVQNKLFGKNPTDLDLTAGYVVSDIKEMDFLASRIQSAVSATLSLQQSEIANRQSEIANDQNDTAISQAEEAVKQGRTLMVFTVTTILFLPMSFLSSLFALDVAAFKQTPGWAFAVIFGTSFLLFIPFASYAAWSDKFISLCNQKFPQQESKLDQSPGLGQASDPGIESDTRKVQNEPDLERAVVEDNTNPVRRRLLWSPRQWKMKHFHGSPR